MHVNRFIVAPTTLNHSHRCLSSRRLTGPSSNQITICTMKSVWTPWFGQNDEDIAIAGPCDTLSFLFWKRHRWQLLFFSHSTTLSRCVSGDDNEHRIKIHRRMRVCAARPFVIKVWISNEFAVRTSCIHENDDDDDDSAVAVHHVNTQLYCCQTQVKQTVCSSIFHFCSLASRHMRILVWRRVFATTTTNII